jgi:hypothetical protein
MEKGPINHTVITQFKNQLHLEHALGLGATLTQRPLEPVPKRDPSTDSSRFLLDIPASLMNLFLAFLNHIYFRPAATHKRLDLRQES